MNSVMPMIQLSRFDFDTNKTSEALDFLCHILYCFYELVYCFPNSLRMGIQDGLCFAAQLLYRHFKVFGTGNTCLYPCQFWLK